MKFKKGDKVKIRSDLIEDERYGEEYFVNEMEEYEGKILTIKSIENKKYKVRENGWFWTDKMIEGKVENMKKKEYKGWELLNEIGEGNIKAGTKIKQTNKTQGFVYDLIFDGDCIIEETNEEIVDSGELLDEDFVYEIVEQEQEEINIQDISEFEEIRDISTWSNETLSENQRLIIIKVNALIRALKQLDKKENNK